MTIWRCAMNYFSWLIWIFTFLPPNLETRHICLSSAVACSNEHSCVNNTSLDHVIIGLPAGWVDCDVGWVDNSINPPHQMANGYTGWLKRCNGDSVIILFRICSCHMTILCKASVYLKRGVQPKCGVQDEKCGVQNWKMCSPKQHLYISTNSLLWASTHLIQIQYKS